MSKVQRRVAVIFVLSLLANWVATASKKSEEITCSFEQGSEPYAFGETMMMCVNYIPLMIKQNTYLKVGKTTIIHQKYMWRIFESINIDMVFQMGNSSIYSQAIPYNRYRNSLAFPFIPLVITMDYGKIIDISLQEINDICPNEEVQTKIIKNFYSSSK